VQAIACVQVILLGHVDGEKLVLCLSILFGRQVSAGSLLRSICPGGLATAKNSSARVLILFSLAFVTVLFGCGKPAPPQVSQMSDLLGFVEAKAFYGDRLDWPSVKKAAMEEVSRSSSPDHFDTVLRDILAQLADGHSRLVSPADIAAIESRAASSMPLEIETSRGIVVVRLGSFWTRDQDQVAEFTQSIRAKIDSRAGNETCGWIVDLRQHGGGAASPALDGLVRLLDRSASIRWQVRRSNLDKWIGRNPVEKFWDRKSSPDIEVDPRNVAILHGRKTASAGELVVLAFRGQQNVRSFGYPTAGIPTGNRGKPLQNGGMLLVASTVPIDRTGTAWSSSIPPDVIIEAERKGEPPDEMDMAKSWLRSTTCAPKIKD
jgi:carboxyl-terminal processing protease